MSSHDDTIEKLEKEITEKRCLIGSLRAQVSKAITEEKKIQAEYDEITSRVASLEKRREELVQLKKQESVLTEDIREREEKKHSLEANLAELQEKRQPLLARVALLRAQFSNEESAAEKDKAEVARLEKILSENAARKEKILQDIEFQQKSEIELKVLEDQYAQIAESIPLLRKEYEQTRLLVEEMKNNTNPIAESILAIWSKLPPDVLDKRLIFISRTANEGE